MKDGEFYNEKKRPVSLISRPALATREKPMHQHTTTGIYLGFWWCVARINIRTTHHT